jgi:translocation protein SEC72
MATAASDIDTYTHLPLQIDPSSKTLSLPPSFPTSISTSTDTDTGTSTGPSAPSVLNLINTLHSSLKTLDTANSIPPPQPTNLATQKRTAQITKLRETASTAFRKSQFAEAVRLYGYAIDMAAGRPSWEPVGLIREELAGLYRDRAQARMGVREWVEGWKDCEASVECKRPQGEKGKVWWRGGKCLMEMGRFAEAVEWLARGVDCEVSLQAGEEGRELRAFLDEARKRAEHFSTV